VVTLDPGASEVTFTLSSALHEVHGTFELERGRILFDLETGRASGSVVLDATSAETGNGLRDGKMHEKVLESDRYPEIELVARAVSGTVPGKVRLDGTFRFHGDEHPVRLELALKSEAGDRVTAETSFAVPYIEWGLEDPSLPLLKVDREVQVRVVAHGRLTTAAAAGPSER
jgi:polyisoprenoid-binding protein YceI